MSKTALSRQKCWNASLGARADRPLHMHPRDSTATLRTPELETFVIPDRSDEESKTQNS